MITEQAIEHRANLTHLHEATAGLTDYHDLGRVEARWTIQHHSTRRAAIRAGDLRNHPDRQDPGIADYIGGYLQEAFR